jgi:hypothetical protein
MVPCASRDLGRDAQGTIVKNTSRLDAS